MIKKGFLFSSILFSSIVTLYGQNLNLDEYDIVIQDTLINKSDFIRNGKNLDSIRLKFLTFTPKSDGQKSIYYLSGELSGQGNIKSKKEDGFWVFWHKNGQKAREGSFEQGKRIGTHKYWYPSGKLRGVGNFWNDTYHGKWTMYKEDGVEKEEKFYKEGKLINE